MSLLLIFYDIHKTLTSSPVNMLVYSQMKCMYAQTHASV